MELGILSVVKPMQPSKAETPMVVFSKVTEVKPVQFLKALSPIEAMRFGMFTEVKAVQPSNCDSAMAVF